MPGAKRTDDDDERKAVRAEIEARYRANAPVAGDWRDQALTIARELQSAIEECIHSLSVNEGAAGAAERLRRMRIALYAARTEIDLTPMDAIGLLWPMRLFYRAAQKNVEAAWMITTFARDANKPQSRAVADWSDQEIRRVLEAKNFDVAMARALTEHDCPMTDKNVCRIRKKVFGIRKKTKAP